MKNPSPVPHGAGLFLKQKDNEMKKIITAILALIAIPTTAQINGDGYYRIQNNASERYITITDSVNNNTSTSTAIVDLNNISTWKGFDNVKSNPASIIYIEAVGSKYDLAGQGLSVHQLTGGKAYVDLKNRAEGIYLIQASAKQGGITVTKTLFDGASDDEYDYVSDDGATTHQYWRIKPVDTEDNYIGITPTVQTNDGWYGTIYAAFPFKLVSSGMAAYYVDGIHEGQFQLKEISDEVKPAATPLIIKCSSNNAEQNKILPVIAATTAPSDNKLRGTYFASSLRKHIARVEFDNSTMRVLDTDDTGNLIFTNPESSYLANSKYIPKNTAYLYDTTGLIGDYLLVSRDTFSGISNIEVNTQKIAINGTFTLSGVQVDDNKVLRPGIYIKDGKKVVIK